MTTKLGRPRSYKSRAQLQKAMERYFSKIRRVVPLYDKNGEPFINEDGEAANITEYAEPPTVAGLCVHLGIGHETFRNYKSDPEFADIVAAAKLEIEKYNSTELMNRSQVRGIIFNLANNFGWSEKKEVEMGDKTRESLDRQYAMSLTEKRELLREIAKAVADDEI